MGYSVYNDEVTSTEESLIFYGVVISICWIRFCRKFFYSIPHVYSGNRPQV